MIYFLPLRKQYFVAAGLILLILIGIKLTSSGIAKNQEILQDAFLKMQKLSSYSYTSEVRIMEKEKVTYLSQVEGIKSEKGAWAKGTILGTPVEILCVNNTTYFRDVQDGKWVTLKGINLGEAESLVNELNPLKVLAFDEIKNVRYRGVEKIDGVNCLVFEGWPSYIHPVLKHLYYDYEGKFYIEKRSKKIKRVILRAKSRFNQNIVLAVRITFKESGSRVKLPSPR